MIRSMLSAPLPGRQPLILAAMLLAAPQAPLPRYRAELLECAAFREEVRTDIRSESGSVLRQESAGRDGVLVVEAAKSDSGLALTAWYDSLTVWRQGPEGRLTPDAEGLLGGRWRGALSEAGRYAGEQVPFIPDEVAEIADLRGVMADFFPPLGGGVLRPASSGDGHFLWNRNLRADTSGAVNDTLEVPMRQESAEEGTLTWDRRFGPVQWQRTITVTGLIAAKGLIRRSIRSVVTQRIRVVRLPRYSCR